MVRIMKKFGNKGYSLIELLVIVTIIAILSTAVGISVVRYIRKSRHATDANMLDSVRSASVAYYNLNMEGKKTSWKIEYVDGNGNKQVLRYKDVVRGGSSAQENAERNKNIWPADKNGRNHKYICFYMDPGGVIQIDPPNDKGDTSTGGSGSVVKSINKLGGATYSKCSYKLNKWQNGDNGADRSLYRQGVAVCLLDVETGETRVGWNLYFVNGQYKYYDLQSVIWQDEEGTGAFDYR